jgi:hypothetical protein
VVRRDRLALAGFAIDLGPLDALGDGAGHEQVIDARTEVLVEVARAVVPPVYRSGSGWSRR